MDVLALVRNGEFNEFDIGYTTLMTSCDTNMDVLNYNTLQWDRFSHFRLPLTGICGALGATHTHILAEQTLSASDYLDANNRMKIRPVSAGTPGMTIRALRINPKYKAMSLAAFYGVIARGLHYDGSVFWMGEFKLNKLSAAGEILEAIETPVYAHSGLAWDGEKFWTVGVGNLGGEVKIQAFDKAGALSCAITVAQTMKGGLTYSQDKLWVGALNGSDPVILVVDPPSSCLAGTAQIDETIPLAVTEINAMATDGTHIFVATDDELIKFTTYGVAVDTYDLPVEKVQGLSWHSGGMWMIHGGPLHVRTDGFFISRFQLP